MLKSKQQPYPMHKITQLIILFSIAIITNNSYGQTINASIEDYKTKKPIPYVTVVLSNKKGVITTDVVQCRYNGEYTTAKPEQLKYIDL